MRWHLGTGKITGEIHQLACPTGFQLALPLGLLHQQVELLQQVVLAARQSASVLATGDVVTNYDWIPEWREEPIVAYRWMHTDLWFHKQHFFQSIIYDHDWKSGWNVADGKPVFHPMASHGFYSYKNILSAMSGDWLSLSMFSVLISVSLAGVIVEHEVGYRSEWMKLDRIEGWGENVNGRMIRELRDRYDMDVAHTNAVNGKRAATFFGLRPLWKK